MFIHHLRAEGAFLVSASKEKVFLYDKDIAEKGGQPARLPFKTISLIHPLELRLFLGNIHLLVLNSKKAIC